jgi:hypothetical protein
MERKCDGRSKRGKGKKGSIMQWERGWERVGKENGGKKRGKKRAYM